MIARAKSQKDGQLNLTWGSFINDAVASPKKAKTTRKKTVKTTS